MSPHFRRLIQYFVGLSDLSYVVSLRNPEFSESDAEKIGENYKKVSELLAMMDIKNQFSKILTVCLREDSFFGTFRVGKRSIIVQQLPSDYCKIAVIEDNVPNVSFDFSYFDTNLNDLEFYPDEFKKKYSIYKKDSVRSRWQELDSPNSFAVKCNTDMLHCSIPPFIGVLREIYEIEDYKQLKLAKTEIENYAMLVMTLNKRADGEWAMDFNTAKEFWQNLDKVLPEEIGSILSPMPIEKISFERPNGADVDNIADAENHLFSAAGVSSLLFNNPKASSNALLLSIKADQAITYGITKSIAGVLNRFIKSKPFGKDFEVKFLDCSPYNRKEVGDSYLRACQYGLPMVSYFCASQGLQQSEMDSMNFLEDRVLGIKSKFMPLRSSSTLSSSDIGDGSPGSPTKDIGELTDSGEKSRENE